jgi:hypothetical protein
MKQNMAMCLAFGSILVVLSAFGAVGRAQGKSQEDLRKPLIGTWRLTSIDGGAGLASDRGAKPTGIIMYDPHGLMNLQITRDRPRPKLTGAPTPEQALEAIRGYTAYWGTIDEQAQTVTHHPQGMLFGSGGDYVRKFELKDGGNRIVLTQVFGATMTHYTWERVR